MDKKENSFGNRCKKIILFGLTGILLFSAGIGTGLLLQPKTDDVQSGYAANPTHEYLTGSAAWQMSAEAHALMMQSFHIAEKNIAEMVNWAEHQLNGYHWIEENGLRKLYRNDQRVCVVSDIDDTLVDGVHYTANILGKNGEWTNKAFTDFILSEGCTALPGAVEFADFCVNNGVSLFYVTNRYDQGYKVSEAGYADQKGYQKVKIYRYKRRLIPCFGWQDAPYDLMKKTARTAGKSAKDPRKYLKQVVALDIETTAYFEDELIERRAMFHWQVSYNNEYLVTGRTIEDLLQFLQRLSDALGFARVTIIVQNLSYENMFLCQALYKTFGDLKYFMLASRKVQSFECANMRFVDTAVMSGMSLERMSEDYDLYYSFGIWRFG